MLRGWYDDGAFRKVDREVKVMWTVPYVGDEQPNVSPTVAARLDTLCLFQTLVHPAHFNTIPQFSVGDLDDCRRELPT